MTRFNELSRVGHFYCFVVTILLGASSYGIAIGEDGCQIDDIVARIEAEGPGTRLVLPSIQPVKDGPSGTLKLAPSTEPNKYEYDAIVRQGAARFDNFGTLAVQLGTIEYQSFSKLRFPNGPKSGFLFKGKVSIGTTTFLGNDNEPLQFVLLEKHGLVYLCGSGSVALSNRKTVSLPPPIPASPTPHSAKSQVEFSASVQATDLATTYAKKAESIDSFYNSSFARKDGRIFVAFVFGVLHADSGATSDTKFLLLAVDPKFVEHKPITCVEPQEDGMKMVFALSRTVMKDGVTTAELSEGSLGFPRVTPKQHPETLGLPPCLFK